MTTTNPTPAADVRQMIEDVQARHYQYPALAEALGRAEPNSCVTCSQKWPCDAVRLADKLEQAVTALGEANVMADEVKAYGDCEHNEFGRVFTAMHNYRAALRRMAGGE